MTSVSTDRRQGVNAGAAIKVPVAACATSAITLSGEQTIDGVAVVSGNRVLVTSQSSGVDNGIYECDTGTWSRAVDANGPYDFVTGSLIRVNAGTSNSGFWYLSTTGTIKPGTTSLAFAMASSTLAVISAFMQTMLDDTTAAQARNTLLIDAKTTVASVAGATADIWTTTGHTIDYTGTNTATGFAAAPYAGATKELLCAGACGFTGGANFIVAGRATGETFTAAAGDRILVLAETTTKFRLFPLKANGSAVNAVTVPRLLQNVGIQVTISAGVTISLTGANAFVPSATNPVSIGFRDPSFIDEGDATLVTVTSPVSMTLSNGSTLGMRKGIASIVWVAAIYVAGAVELAVYYANTSSTFQPVDEDGFITTLAEGGGGATAANTWYSTTSRSNVPFVVIGYFKSTQAAAGTWSTAPSMVVANPKRRIGDNS